ncbi:iron chaperone [Gilvibacter sp.]|uniref:iron chaperone n=1 Tax=Gilvibacter sp. TaxID=2729997 RepID=UPI003F49F52D
MKVNANTIEEYFQAIPEERQPYMKKLHQTIVDNLPDGFQVGMSYGMVGYVVPHSLYPAGYHCDPKLPLPFISIASQKNFIALYHMGIYANPELLQWFQEEYPKHVKTKLDMGKSCIRFKKPEVIPYDLIGELCRQMDPQKWIDIYESVIK